jgi:hypothetical protein
MYTAQLSETEMLLQQHATEIAAARDRAVLLPAASRDQYARADRRAVNLYSNQPHIEVIARQRLQTIDA